jgi:hypothetical protein
MGQSDPEAEAIRILDENFSEEHKNAAYASVLDQTGRFIEENKLRKTDFPQLANSSFYILTLGLVKKGLAFKPADAEKYLRDQLTKIRDGGPSVVDEIFREITA